MATYSNTETRTVGSVLAATVQNVAFNYRAWRAEAAQRRRIVRELNTYSDRDLQELGFSRSDIPAIAAGRYSR
jgi:uncharacterized protein YjiS (DUF1127 family)